jgi:hypothetical protein
MVVQAFLICALLTITAAARAAFTIFSVSGSAAACWTTGSDGWTIICATTGTGSCSSGTYTGTCIVYVSQSGGGAGSCTPQSPPVTNTPSSAILCQTIAAGYAALRNNTSDQMLLAKGDTWSDTNQGWAKSGISSSQPMLLGSYGSGARPIIQSSPASDAVFNFINTTAGDNLAIIDIEFYSYKRDPSNPSFVSPPISEVTALNMLYNAKQMRWVLIEGCKFSWFTGSIGAQDQLAGTGTFLMRRNILINNYENVATGKESQGIYLGGMASILLEENTFSHNGWNATWNTTPGSTEFNHNWYIAVDGVGGSYNAPFTGPATIRGNIVAYDGPASGSQTRVGGTLDNNLWVSGGIGQYSSNFGGVGGEIKNNVVMNINDNSTYNGAGFQISYDVTWNTDNPSHAWAGVTTSNNIFSTEINSTGNAHAYTIGIIGGSFAGSTNVTISNDIAFVIDSFVLDGGNMTVITGNNIDLAGTNNNPGGNAPAEPFPAPTRSIGSYDTTLGGAGTLDHFLSLAEGQTKSSWNTAYMANAVNNYIRAGFGR